MDASGTEAEQQPTEDGRAPVGIDVPGGCRPEMATTSSAGALSARPGAVVGMEAVRGDAIMPAFSFLNLPAGDDNS
jgi:hypothetical protein